MTQPNRPSYVNPDQGLEQGKVPPQATDLEEAVLGAILLEPQCFEDVILIVHKPDMFYKIEHQKIFSSMVYLYNENTSIDMLTVTQQLKKDEALDLVGGPLFVSNLTKYVMQAANVEHHARIIAEKFIQRELIRVSGDIYNEAFMDSTDPLDLLDRANNDMANVGSDIGLNSRSQTNQELVLEVISDAERAANGSEIVGISSGIPDEDRITGGDEDGKFYIIAARPAMGKSAKALQKAYYTAIVLRKPVAFFSLEMPAKDLMVRLMSVHTKIDSKKIKSGRLSPEEWDLINSSVQEIIDSPLEIIDNMEEFTEIRKKCILKKKKTGLASVFVDYLQLVRYKQAGRNREQEVSEISRGFKSLAKLIDCPVTALSQLSRAVETRGGAKRPMLSDLRESGCLSIETSMLYSSRNVLTNPVSRKLLLSLDVDKIKEMNSKNIPRKPREVFRLKLTSGRFVDATSNHPILTSSGYKELKDIRMDDSIACAVNFEADGRFIPESKFIGWMLGNGCMYGYNVPSFITNDKVIADNFLEFIEGKFGFTPKDHPHYQSKVYQYDCTNSPTGNRTKEGNPVTRWLKENDLWGNKAKDKSIPDWFMDSADTESVKLLLQGLWETDGSIQLGESHSSISYSTTSLKMAHQIIYLLAKIGVFSNLDDGHMSKKATTLCYKIKIDAYPFQKVFKEKIKLDGVKSERIKKITPRLKGSKYFNRMNRDTTLEIHGKSKLNKGKLRIQTHNNRRITKDHLRTVIEAHNKAGYTDLDDYKWLLSESIIWDNVKSIESIGVQEIFDRHVPKTNNFIVNGIIVHNSLEQDADVVMFLYRPEYYGIEMSEEFGGSTEGLTELIVAKNRGGSTGTAPMKFTKETTSFGPWEEQSYGGTAVLPTPIRDESYRSPMPRSDEFDDFDNLYGEEEDVF